MIRRLLCMVGRHTWRWRGAWRTRGKEELWGVQRCWYCDALRVRQLGTTWRLGGQDDGR